jgi:hypothetical protein
MPSNEKLLHSRYSNRGEKSYHGSRLKSSKQLKPAAIGSEPELIWLSPYKWYAEKYTKDDVSGKVVGSLYLVRITKRTNIFYGIKDFHWENLVEHFPEWEERKDIIIKENWLADLDVDERNNLIRDIMTLNPHGRLRPGDGFNFFKFDGIYNWGTTNDKNPDNAAMGFFNADKLEIIEELVYNDMTGHFDTSAHDVT